MVFVLLWVMMNSLFHALESTALQFLSLVQDVFALVQNLLASISLP